MYPTSISISPLVAVRSESLYLLVKIAYYERTPGFGWKALVSTDTIGKKGLIFRPRSS